MEGPHLMALTAKGFGTGSEEISGLDWSLLGEGIGTDSDFATTGAFAATQGPGVREVVIAAGRSTAWGVDVNNTTPVSLFIAEAIGGSRAWAICLRRDWTTGLATIVALDCGSASRQRPASATLRRLGGSVDHQLIAYAVASPGSTSVQIIDGRIFADKARYAMSDEARAWDEQPGRLTKVHDGGWWSGVPNPVTGLTTAQSAFKQFYAFNIEGLQAQFIGRPDGNVRIPWPMGALPFTPIVVGQPAVHIAPTTRTARDLVFCFVDWSKPPTRTEGNFLLRRGDGAPFVDTTWAPTAAVLSRLSITIAEG